MNKEFALELALIGLLVGGAIFFACRQGRPSNSATNLLPAEEESRRYKNKEIRRIEYNEDGLPTLIEITRDSTIV
ncbi:hypothetical protein ES703_118780 [subsurface metagenome]